MEQLEKNPRYYRSKKMEKAGHIFFFIRGGLCSYVIGADQERRFQVRSSKSASLFPCSLEKYNRDCSVTWPVRNCMTLGPFFTSLRRE